MLIDIPKIMNHDRPKLLLRIFFFTPDHRWKRSARENEEIDETVNFQHFLLFVCKNILNFYDWKHHFHWTVSVKMFISNLLYLSFEPSSNEGWKLPSTDIRENYSKFGSRPSVCEYVIKIIFNQEAD